MSAADKMKFEGDYFDAFSRDMEDISSEKLNKSDVPNQIGQRYQITDVREIEYSSEYSDAYVVVDSLDEENKDLYALVYNKSMPFRLSEIMKLTNSDMKNVITPMEYGVTKVGTSEEEFFVAILQKPKGKSLKVLIEEGFRFDKNNLINTYLPQLLGGIKRLHQQEITHGSINANNVFIDDEQLVLADCISSITGANQEEFYETVDRAQCNTPGKFIASRATDFYSLGILIFHGMSGRDFRSTNSSELIRQKLYHGTFHYLNAAYLMNGQIGDLIRGLVADTDELRWGASEVDSVLQGGMPSLTSSADLSYLSRAITFNGKEHYSKKSLAYDLSQDWEGAKEFIKTEKIKRWLESSSSQEKYLEALSLIQNIYINKSISKNLISADDERLMKLLAIIDPDGPTRFKNLVFYKENLGPMLAHSLAYSNSETTQTLAAMMYVNSFAIYEILASSYSMPHLNTMIISINRCSEFLKKSEYGFGLERCLYDLNPTLVCQSPLVKKVFCIGLDDVLKYLDSADFEFEQLVAKKTVSCFLANKIVMMTEIKNQELNLYPLVQKSRAYQIMGIFAKAQKHSKISTLNNLSNIIMQSVRDVLDSALKSVTIREKFFIALEQSAKSGSIADLQNMALNSKFINDDIDGYTKALKRGAEISRDLFSYNNRKTIDFDIRRKSLRFAVRFSYVCCGLIILSIVLQSI